MARSAKPWMDGKRNLLIIGWANLTLMNVINSCFNEMRFSRLLEGLDYEINQEAVSFNAADSETGGDLQ